MELRVLEDRHGCFLDAGLLYGDRGSTRSAEMLFGFVIKRRAPRVTPHRGRGVAGREESSGRDGPDFCIHSVRCRGKVVY